MINRKNTFVGALAALALFLGAASTASAADVKVLVDTPYSFRATFTGVDTDPATIGGNDFQVFTFDFWTVLVNLRGDAVAPDGTASGFYEIQLTHTGTKIANPAAPVVNTFLFYGGLQPGVTLTDSTISSQPSGAGSEYVTTTVNIVFDPLAGETRFDGSIAGDSDLDGDGTPDSDQMTTDAVVTLLNDLRDAGVITGKEMGQIIKQTKQPVKN